MTLKKDIKKKLAELTDAEKLLVLNYLVHELDRPDPKMDKLWITEVGKREKELASGKTKTLSHEQVFGKYKR